MKEGNAVSMEEWTALRDVLAGVLPRSRRVQTMARQARAAAVHQMAGAIYTLQREVMAMLVGRWEAMREQRTVAEEREREYRALDAMTRAAEAAAAKEARRDVEMAAQRAQAERVQAEHAKERASRDAGERARRAVH